MLNQNEHLRNLNSNKGWVIKIVDSGQEIEYNQKEQPIKKNFEGFKFT